MSCDCTTISGPCLVIWKGYAMRSKGDVVITKETTLTPVTVDSVGVTDQRVNTVRHTIAFTPSGMIAKNETATTDFSVLIEPFTDASTEPKPGQSLFRWDSTAITGYATADSGAATTITIGSTSGMVVGQYVTISGSSTAGYNGTWRIEAVTSSTQLKLGVAFTSDPTTDGTLSFSNALVIYPLFQSGGTEKIITFQNVALTGLPTLTFSATETVLGSVTFTAIYHRKLEATDVDAIVDYRAWSAPGSTLLDDFYPDAILTSPPAVRYGADSVDAWTSNDPVAAPWKDFCTTSGVTVALNLSTNDRIVDSCGLVDITFSDLSITATAQPVGELMTDEEIQKVLKQQDMGGAYEGRKRGQSMKSSTPLMLWIRLDGGVVDFKITSTAVSAGAENYSATATRNGDLVWQGLRVVTSGVRQPLFTVAYP